MNTSIAPRLLRMREVCDRTGLSRAQIYKWAAAGTFPSSVALGQRTVAWLEQDITAWIAARVEAARAAH